MAFDKDGNLWTSDPFNNRVLRYPAAALAPGAGNEPSADLSNRTPELVIQWDGAKLGITGQEVNKIVLDTDPRIVLARAGGRRSEMSP